MSDSQPPTWLEPLNQREQEILLLIEEGLSNQEIAHTLHLSKETIIWYNKQTFSKLGVNSRTKAVAKARKYGLLPVGRIPVDGKYSPPPHNFPSQPTPFVGREAELAELQTMLMDPAIRLVSIIGPGGIGKTRLALAAAETMLKQSSNPTPPGSPAFSDGFFFIPLVGIEKPDLVLPELASVLNYQFEKGGARNRTPKQQLLDYLKHKQLLLIMDNFEQLIEGADLLADLLSSAPGIKILVTSRERLNLVEEHLYLTHGLPYPEQTESGDKLDHSQTKTSHYPAILLFLQCAGRLRPDLRLTEENLAAIIRICQQVEGMPLALELSASWVDILSISEIASEIEHSYEFIHTGIRNIQERHRSIQAVFDSTWLHLSLEEQQVFTQFSLFHGSFTRRAAQQVTRPTATLGTLASLTNKSLIMFDRENGRFHIHELLRQYGADKIALRPDKAASFKERLGDYFSSISQRLASELKGPRQIRAMAEIEADFQNIRAAWEWAVSQRRFDLVGRFMETLGLFYQWKGRYQEGEASFGAAVAQLTANDEVDLQLPLDEDRRTALKILAELLIWHGYYYFLLGQISLSDHLTEKSLRLLNRLASFGLDVRRETAFAKCRQGVSAMIGGEREVARQLCLASLERYQTCEDPWGRATVLDQLCSIDWYLGDQASAIYWGEESLRIRQEMGDQRGIADSYVALGGIVIEELDFEKSLRFNEQAVRLYEELADREKIAYGIYKLGIQWMLMGDYPRGYDLQVESYHMARELNLQQIIPNLTCQIAYLTNHLGRYDETRRWTDLCMPLAQEMGDQRSIAVSHYSLGLAALSKGLYSKAYQSLMESAKMLRAMKDRRLLAMILLALGRAAFGVGMDDDVKPNLFEALKYCVDVHSSQAPFETFVQIAYVLCQAGESWAKERSIELYSLATRYPYVANSRWLMDTAGSTIERSMQDLPSEIVETCQKHGQGLEVWSTAAALRDELADRGWR